MRLLVLLLLAFSSCPPPPIQQCERILVDSTGNVNTGFAGGTGGGPGPGGGNAPPLGLVGTPLTVTLFAPLSSCLEDTLRADATLVDAQNAPVAFSFDGAPTRIGTQGVVKTSLTFTPTQPGRHTLHVSFEPSIGVRNLQADVAADGIRGLTQRVPITGAGCLSNATWALSDDTIACEGRALGSIAIVSADGGLTRFDGEQLVVVDTVLWSINKPNLTLERHVFEDGGVRLTDTFINFPATPTPAMHDVDLALRFRANGRLTLVRLIPGANSRVQELTLDGNVGPPLAYFEEPNEVIWRWSPSECSFNNCINLNDIVGLEPGFVWRTTSEFGSPFPGLPGAWARPTTLNAFPRFRLDSPLEPVTTPTSGFERMPVWLVAEAGRKAVMVSVADDALSFSAWPRGEVLRVGRHHVVLTDADPGLVRVIQR